MLEMFEMTKKISWLLIVIMAIGLIGACSSDSEPDDSADQVGSVDIGNLNETVAADDHDDADDHGTVSDEHADDDHVDVSTEEHEDEHSEAADHPHGEAVVDPNAPIVHVYASEFGYEAESLEAHAGEPFTIMLHNTGALEHDIVIEGFEDYGGIHLIPGEDGKATFTLSEHGEYKVYCTVPGHRNAGMESTLVVEDDHA
jgi:uncharacterized cupredoxin-like copper-binding protein